MKIHNSLNVLRHCLPSRPLMWIYVSGGQPANWTRLRTSKNRNTECGMASPTTPFEGSRCWIKNKWLHCTHHQSPSSTGEHEQPRAICDLVEDYWKPLAAQSCVPRTEFATKILRSASKGCCCSATTQAINQTVHRAAHRTPVDQN
jgi:hypothetical protein